ncbi:hypothetical protein DICVIV_13481 [Dictyocaulus viviparus]|uniref:Uncharacterized protein n=1 Tax=Dictyocaulus viviparus TaxID=29172 RepID=A0A0D8XA94_DICVI|nr:hypothetical protein DICVIV_13481 [Dictyocaulus viviparus]
MIDIILRAISMNLLMRQRKAIDQSEKFCTLFSKNSTVLKHTPNEFGEQTMSVGVVLVAICVIPMLQGDILDPDWRRNLEMKIKESMRNSGAHFDLNWELNLEKKIEQSTKNSRLSVVNDMLRANINGKTYTAKLPRIHSLGTNSATRNINGQRAEIITISINGDKSVYTTIKNVTTVTDGKEI